MNRILLAAGLLVSCALATPMDAQQTPGADAFLDPAAETTLDRALEARLREITGIDSYEARVWERVYVGLTGSAFRRERGLFSGERVARVRWEEGERVIRWEGAVQGVPVAGLRSDEDPDMADRMVEALANITEGLSSAFYTPGYGPGDDRLGFSNDQWALHPVSDTAHLHYRYRSGDTLRVTMPPDRRTVTLVELRVEARRGHPRYVSGSFWFDEATGQMVRATYRPSTPYYLAADDGAPEGARGLGRAFQAEIRQITVDYGLHHFQWWLPYRFALTLEVRAGGLMQVPVTVEWRMDDYRVNEPRSTILDAETVPEGWTRTETMRPPRSDAAEADSTRLVTLVPPADSLHLSPELTRGPDGRLLGPDPIGFSERELEELREELDRILPPTLTYFPRLAWGLEDGLLRYNRVEGLSVGLAGEIPLWWGLSGRAEGRIGTADRSPMGELRVQRGDEERREAFAVYRRMAHTSDWSNPLDLGASVSTLVRGSDRGEYYRTHGAELRVVRRHLPGSPELRLFGEAHRAVERNTDFHLTGLFGSDTLRTNIVAEEATWYGGSLALRGDRGSDPGALRLFGSTRIEAAWGEERDYQRAAVSAGAARRLGPIAVALEGGVGAGWGNLPVQRAFFLGGPATIRGVRPASIVGESHWFGRAELARGFPAVRLALFSDWGWAGPREDFGSGRPVHAVGAGISFLDGIARFDLARELDPGRAWRVHFYLDGLL